MRRVIFIFIFFIITIFFSERAARGGGGGGGGGGAARLLLFLIFPCSADHERDWPPCKVVFFGLATNALNVRNNNNNNSSARGSRPSYHRGTAYDIVFSGLIYAVQQLYPCARKTGIKRV